MHESSQVTTVVKDEVELLPILECNQLLFKTPVVLIFGLTLPGESVCISCQSPPYGMKQEVEKLRNLHRGS